MAILGIIILALAIIGILSLRHYTNTQGSPAMKTAMKIGDFLVWVRFIGFSILLLFFMVMVFMAKRAH
jgi:hypothetical protein